MIKANKGEWAEFYAFLKILEERHVPAADENLSILADKSFVFRKIFRSESSEDLKIYDITSEDKTKIVILNSEGSPVKTLKILGFEDKLHKIFSKIKSASDTTFILPEAQEIMNDLICKTLKANNTKKADIEAEILDRISDTICPLGFSVKSQVGGLSTLLNASKATNFLYKVKNLRDNFIESVNVISSKSKVRDRIKEIINYYRLQAGSLVNACKAN